MRKSVPLLDFTKPLEPRMLKDVRPMIDAKAWPILVKHGEEQGYKIDACPYGQDHMVLFNHLHMMS